MSNFSTSATGNATEVVLHIQSVQDSAQTAGIETTYDSVWTAQVPVEDPTPLERVMLAEDKLFVVLAVVLIIWFGIAAMLWRTDRKIRNLERRVADSGSHGPEAHKEGE
ncbi:MAG: CcmD family protein [Rhodothermales bacterium]